MTLKKLTPYVIALAFTGCIAGCVHEPIEPSNPSTTNDTLSIDTTKTVSAVCDEDTVYFQNDILPLIVSNCAMSGCHDANSAQDGIVLDSYANIMKSGEVRAERPDNSELF